MPISARPGNDDTETTGTGNEPRKAPPFRTMESPVRGHEAGNKVGNREGSGSEAGPPHRRWIRRSTGTPVMERGGHRDVRQDGADRNGCNPSAWPVEGSPNRHRECHPCVAITEAYGRNRARKRHGDTDCQPSRRRRRATGMGGPAFFVRHGRSASKLPASQVTDRSHAPRAGKRPAPGSPPPRRRATARTSRPASESAKSSPP